MIVAVGFRSATRIGGNTTGTARFVLGPVPILSPFPDVADHVEKAEVIGRIGANW